MKRRALTGLAALTLFDIATAQAQPPPVNAWTSFYVGANGGYRWSQAEGNVPLGELLYDSFGAPVIDSDRPVTVGTSSPFSYSGGGGVAGVHGGYNFQYSRNWLVGWEADANWGRTSQTFTVNIASIVPNSLGLFSYTSTVDWSSSLRGRVGYVYGPWMLYGTAGISMARMSLSGSGGYNNVVDGFDGYTVSTSLGLSASKVLFGPIAGAGIEYLIANRWTFRIEYLYASYGSVDLGNGTVTNSFFYTGFTIPCQPCVSASSGAASSSLTTQTLRVGLTARLP